MIVRPDDGARPGQIRSEVVVVAESKRWVFLMTSGDRPPAIELETSKRWVPRPSRPDAIGIISWFGPPDSVAE